MKSVPFLSGVKGTESGPAPRWVIFLLGALIALAAGPAVTKASAATDTVPEPHCDLPNCSWTTARSCGVCNTINGAYVMYVKSDD